MSKQGRTPPQWLLNEIGLAEGEFSKDNTAVTGRPDVHNSAVLDVGEGSPTRITVNVQRRPDWERIRERLRKEGL
jgi:hypothetical protein